MKKDRINIWPLNPIYIVIYVIVIVFMLLSIILPFWLLVNNKPINFFDLGYINEGYIQFLTILPLSGFLIYFFLRTGIFSFKVSFTATHIIVPRVSEIQEKNVEIPCAEILNCDVTMEGFYYFFTFTSSNGKKKKMFITRFSFKQMEAILKMIQERGGLIDQNINEIINPLWIRKKK